MRGHVQYMRGEEREREGTHTVHERREREKRDNSPVLALSCVPHRGCNYHHQRIICREGGAHEHRDRERERERVTAGPYFSDRRYSSLECATS